jgi:CheY-like chemotaxis protein
MEEDIRQAVETGFSAHLTKPVRPEQLRDAVAHLLDQRGPR